jgi:hypothetical protein
LIALLFSAGGRGRNSGKVKKKSLKSVIILEETPPTT